MEERVARGLAWREIAPIEGQGEYQIERRRKNPIDILRAQDDARVQDLVPIRYGRMSASAFAFYRGSAAVMAYDLASQPWTPGRTQICGDAHLSNFGVFASPERDLVFDVNDFDETLPGPFEWDVKRLAASFVLAARDRGFKRKEARPAVRAALQAYRTAIAELAPHGHPGRLVHADRRADAARLRSPDGQGQGGPRSGRQEGDGELRRRSTQDVDARPRRS